MGTIAWWKPGKKKLGLLGAGSLATALLLHFDGRGTWFIPLDIAYRMNNQAVHESLSIKVALITTLVALAPAVIATLLAAGIRGRAQRRHCIELMMRPMDTNEIPDAFPPHMWLNSPKGVLGYMYLLEILSAKAGASIFCTVVGVCIYLITEGQPVYFLLFASVLLMYAICVFPAFVKWVFAFGYRHGIDTKQRYLRRRLWRKFRAKCPFALI
ncbi:hypothetical protein LMG28688_02678 [Paraburkholderia caffeinitolerans]|uniref:Uncharacterized protein n=2 Tax=Paraburkholderia caffeinitolerans TaxID=1723730 RepID=A0A6J5G0E1_9BURK|nr:hypothetical protein [Paraburkholderia dokdonensis]CAB3788386.1 hypothetical protein LMG28688_02678 [Paraburkholderia caffeinitolerans]